MTIAEILLGFSGLTRLAHDNRHVPLVFNKDRECGGSSCQGRVRISPGGGAVEQELSKQPPGAIKALWLHFWEFSALVLC